MLTILCFYLLNTACTSTPSSDYANSYANNSYSLLKSNDLFNDKYSHLRALYAQAKNSPSSVSREDRYQLSNYPLSAYLDYSLSDNAHTLTPMHARNLLSQESNTYLSHTIREKWLRHLARQQNWSDYIIYYNSNDASITSTCQYLMALIKTGQQQNALAQVAPVWLKGSSLPSECTPVFDIWKHSLFAHKNVIWKRLHMSLQKGNIELAKYINKFLTRNDFDYAQLYIKVYESPSQLSQYGYSLRKHPQHTDMFSNIINKLAQTHPIPAADYLNRFSKIRYDSSQRLHIEKGFRHALDKKLPKLLLNSDWKHILALISSLPGDEAQRPKWLYWRARSLEKTGQSRRAKSFYEQASKDRDYYSYLSSDMLNKQYNLNHKSSNFTSEDTSSIGQHIGIQRAIELFRLKNYTQANKEWHYATRHFTKKQYITAANIARRVGWHQQAIFTIAKAKSWDDTLLRFPLVYRNTVKTAGAFHKLDSNWIYAIIRQESAFGLSAKSHVGARGLMQLMPSTARITAKKQNIPYRLNRLNEPGYNILLGSAYLKQMYNKYDQNRILASAAYNAGPGRVNQWLRDRNNMPADIWIENIPFKETRKYVKNILMYNVVYGLRTQHRVKFLQHNERFIN
jgi:soluble lytic murein transglycosylase